MKSPTKSKNTPSNTTVATNTGASVTPTKAKASATPIVPMNWSETYKTKSDAIRALAAAGKSTSEISKLLGIRYQHARNVLTRPAKKSTAITQAQVSSPVSVTKKSETKSVTTASPTAPAASPKSKKGKSPTEQLGLSDKPKLVSPTPKKVA